MNASELAQKMLEWETTIRKANQLAGEIQLAVLSLGKTQTVGSVRATYSKGRTTTDYAAAGKGAISDGALVGKVIDTAPYESTAIDWKKFCEGEGVDLSNFRTQADPSVTVKLEE